MAGAKIDNICSGNWEVVRIFTTDERGKRNVVLFEPGEYRLEFPLPDVARERRGNRVSTATCIFDVQTKTLRFNPTAYRPKSPITVGNNAIYRVVRLNDDELCLRSPHDIETSTEGEPFVTILLRRIR